MTMSVNPFHRLVTPSAGSRSNTDMYLDVSLICLDDCWQVDDARTVAAASNAGTDGPVRRGPGR
jgi:hypothetical protein